jgi:hypothetical protein
MSPEVFEMAFALKHGISLHRDSVSSAAKRASLGANEPLAASTQDTGENYGDFTIFQSMELANHMYQLERANTLTQLPATSLTKTARTKLYFYKKKASST